MVGSLETASMATGCPCVKLAELWLMTVAEVSLTSLLPIRGWISNLVVGCCRNEDDWDPWISALPEPLGAVRPRLLLIERELR